MGRVIYTAMKKSEAHRGDEELIRRCQQGDQRAFERLVHRHYQQAYRLALFWSGNRETALDISQDTFVRVWRNIASIDPERPFAAWLFVIVRNLCRTETARRKRRWWVFSDMRNGFALNTRPSSDAEMPDKVLEQDDRRRALRKALRCLKETDRDIILLQDFQELSYKEISEMLGIPIGSVMSRLYYARKRLAQQIQAEEINRE